jgi:integrase
MSTDYGRPKRAADGTFYLHAMHPIARGPNGRAKSVKLTGQTEGEVYARREELRKLATDARLGVLGEGEVQRRATLVAHGPQRLADVVERYAAAKPERTGRHLRGVWRTRCATLHQKLVVELTEAVCNAWVAEQRAEGMAEGTIFDAWLAVAGAVRHELRAQRIAGLPWGEFKPPRKSRSRLERETMGRECARTAEELVLCLAAARAREDKVGGTGLMFKIGLMAMLGLRQGEATALGWEDVTITETVVTRCPHEVERGDRCQTCGPTVVVHIRYQTLRRWRTNHPEWRRPLDNCKHDSAGSQVLVGFAAEFMVAHRAQLKERGLYDPRGPVFPDQKKRGASWRLYPRLVPPETTRAIAKAAGLPNYERWVTHSWRHTKGTLEAIATNYDLYAVARLMRHAHPMQSLTYIHAARGGARAGVLAAPPEDAHGLLPAAGDRGGYARLLVGRAPPDEALALVQAEERRAGVRGRRAETLIKSSRGAFVRTGEAWRAAGMPGDRPSAVTGMGERAYSKAYASELRATGDREAARTAGTRAKRGLLDAWRRYAVEHGLNAEARHDAALDRAGGGQR